MKIVKSPSTCYLSYKDKKIVEKYNSAIMLLSENIEDEKEFNQIIKQYPKMLMQKFGEIPIVSYKNGKIVEKRYPFMSIEAESDEDEANIIEIVKKYSK